MWRPECTAIIKRQTVNRCSWKFPKDQYEQAVNLMRENKRREGDLPESAIQGSPNISKKAGCVTFKQARNIMPKGRQYRLITV